MTGDYRFEGQGGRVDFAGLFGGKQTVPLLFESPLLVGGKSYSYTFQAEFVRDGKSVVVTHIVGCRSRVRLPIAIDEV